MPLLLSLYPLSNIFFSLLFSISTCLLVYVWHKSVVCGATAASLRAYITEKLQKKAPKPVLCFR